MRPTYVEIDLSAIAHNVSSFAALIAPSKLCTVVKADAYGHGDVPVATTALEAGSDWLAVALVEEGARLREAGVEASILLLSEPPPTSAEEVVAWELTPTVYTVPFIDALARVGRGQAVHLKVDTGMHRVGCAPDRIDELMGACREGGLLVEAVWTHFPVADSDPDFTRGQIELFDEVVSGMGVTMTHMANTPGAILFPESRRDMCRIGLGTYGLHPCAETRSMISLRPAMRVVTHVSHVQRLPAGKRPSYGRRRELGRESTVVTAPIGYADGFLRAMTDNGTALINGRRHPLAGTVTMDQIVIDVGNEPVVVGDQVVLMGRQGDEEITADDWAEAIGTINYEVVCNFGPRVTRRYV